MTTFRDGLMDVAQLARWRSSSDEPVSAPAAPVAPVAQAPKEEWSSCRVTDRAADAAFTELYAQHGARIHRFLRDLLGDAALAADATQETFVRAFRQKDTFDAARAVAPWLFGIARNVSLELRRARFRARRVIADDQGDGDLPEHRSERCPETELLGREALRIVGAAMARLSEERRAMLLLRLDHGLSYDEIADSMGFSLAKVKVEIFRARAVLRETMADYEKGGVE